MAMAAGPILKNGAGSFEPAGFETTRAPGTIDSAWAPAASTAIRSPGRAEVT